MLKNILKETGIIFLIILAICLIFGIILYDYIPTVKTVPSKVSAYTRTNEIQEELNKNISIGQTIIKTYQIDATDLKLYEYTNNYDSGKVNPFEEIAATNTSNSSQKNSTNTTNTSESNNTTGNTSGGFFNKVGK